MNILIMNNFSVSFLIFVGSLLFIGGTTSTANLDNVSLDEIKHIKREHIVIDSVTGVQYPTLYFMDSTIKSNIDSLHLEFAKTEELKEKL